MTTTVAFDIYGTLIDTNTITAKLKGLLGDKANDFSELWRNKQLEYAFRRGLMQRYDSFAVCTAQALGYCCLHFNVLLSENQKRILLDAYAVLPAYDGVKESLDTLAQNGVRLYAFSNGSKRAVNQLLENAQIIRYFTDVISVEDVESFKPDPAVYRHLLQQSGATPSTLYLISCNPFDVIGAAACGIKTIWLKRSPNAVFDPWGIEPTATIKSIEPQSLIKHLKLSP